MAKEHEVVLWCVDVTLVQVMQPPVHGIEVVHGAICNRPFCPVLFWFQSIFLSFAREKTVIFGFDIIFICIRFLENLIRFYNV